MIYDVRDRLGRGDAAGKLELFAELSGVSIEYAQRTYDDTTSDSVVQKGVDDIKSGLERQDIKRHTMGGKRDWAEKGRVIAPLHRPLGYQILSERDAKGRKTHCWLEVVPTEAEAIRKIYRWLVDDSMTSYGIARRLTNEKIPTPTEKAR